MRGTVVLTGTAPSSGIYGQRHGVAHLEHTAGHFAHMAHLAAQKLNRILHLEHTVIRGDAAGIAFLSAHGGIERRPLHDHRTNFAVCQRFHQLRLRGQYRHLRVKSQIIISHKFRCNSRIDGLIHRHVRPHIVGRLAGLAGLVLLLLHTCLKAVLIHRKALFLQDLPCQIQRESVSVIQFKGIGAAKHLAVTVSHGLYHLI